MAQLCATPRAHAVAKNGAFAIMVKMAAINNVACVKHQRAAANISLRSFLRNKTLRAAAACRIIDRAAKNSISLARSISASA